MFKVGNYLVYKDFDGKDNINVIRLREKVVMSEYPRGPIGFLYDIIRGLEHKKGYVQRMSCHELTQYYRPMTDAEQILWLK